MRSKSRNLSCNFIFLWVTHHLIKVIRLALICYLFNKFPVTFFFRKVPNQPILLKSRKIEPEPNGMHHHTDYSIYYYSNDKKQNPIEAFDVEQCFFGNYHRFLPLKILLMESKMMVGNWTSKYLMSYDGYAEEHGPEKINRKNTLKTTKLLILVK